MAMKDWTEKDFKRLTIRFWFIVIVIFMLWYQWHHPMSEEELDARSHAEMARP
jgi:hypothetical protein